MPTASEEDDDPRAAAALHQPPRLVHPHAPHPHNNPHPHAVPPPFHAGGVGVGVSAHSALEHHTEQHYPTDSMTAQLDAHQLPLLPHVSVLGMDGATTDHVAAAAAAAISALGAEPAYRLVGNGVGMVGAADASMGHHHSTVAEGLTGKANTRYQAFLSPVSSVLR